MDIQPPPYIEENPEMNLNGLVRAEVDAATGAAGKPSDEPSLYNVNVREGIPDIPSSGMDESQQQACQRILTKKLAIVQGPPGTGKTFTSVSAIRALFDNMAPDEPPMIIAAQTNHALDQLLTHIMSFDDNIIRLGGRCAKENKEILKRTLYELRLETKDVPGGARGLRACYVSLEHKISEIQQAIMPLLSSSLLTDEELFKQGIITEQQKDSLYEEGWETSGEVGIANGSASNGIADCRYF
jgi:helicase required for RNAi-mediated heterochromatin assembly 1